MFAASQRRSADAARHYRESLGALVAAGDSVWLFKPVVGLAAVAVRCDRIEAAVQLLGTVDELLQRTGARLLPFDVPIYETAQREARATLGETTFAAAKQAGRDLDMEALLAEADTIVAVAEEVARAPRRRGSHDVDDARFAPTPREQEVLRLLAQGKTDREIAEDLFVSRRTVNTHVTNILGQFTVHSRQEAVDRARALGLLRSATDDSR